MMARMRGMGNSHQTKLGVPMLGVSKKVMRRESIQCMVIVGIVI